MQAHLAQTRLKDVPVAVHIQKFLLVSRMGDPALHYYELVRIPVEVLQAQLSHHLAIVWEGVNDPDFLCKLAGARSLLSLPVKEVLQAGKALQSIAQIERAPMVQGALEADDLPLIACKVSVECSC